MKNEEYLNHILTELSKPLDYKWKVQSFTKDKTKAMCVAYIDARDVIQILNKVCIYGWHREHFALGNDKFCKLGVVMPDGSIIWRSDVGESDNETEKAKTSASDGLKRAAVNFGVGLFLYDLDIVKLDAKNDGNYTNVVDKQGNKVWDITAHINGLKGKNGENKSAKNEKSIPPPVLASSGKDFEYVKKRIKEGVPLDKIKESFTITEDVEKLLK